MSLLSIRTPSERVAIGKAVEAELGERRGRPGQNSDNCRTFDEGRTADLAAKRSGFSSGKQYERAKSVVTHGATELIEAMDSGRVAVSTAATTPRRP